MLSTKNSTSWPSSSRKYSAIVRPDRATRARAPGGSFIWPNTSATFDPSGVGLPSASSTLGTVADQWLAHPGPAVAGAAQQAALAAARASREQVADRGARDQDRGLGRLVEAPRSRRADRVALVDLDRTAFVERLAD